MPTESTLALWLVLACTVLVIVTVVIEISTRVLARRQQEHDDAAPWQENDERAPLP